MWGYVATFATGCAFTTALNAIGVAIHGGLTISQHVFPFVLVASLAAVGFYFEARKTRGKFTVQKGNDCH